jgi:hypothetical protein
VLPLSRRAYAHRHFVRLATADATFGNLVVRLDLSHRLLLHALGPRAVRDVEAGVAAGRLAVIDAPLAVYGTGGALLGTIPRRDRRCRSPRRRPAPRRGRPAGARRVSSRCRRDRPPTAAGVARRAAATGIRVEREVASGTIALPLG